jgi:hypothetical protein
MAAMDQEFPLLASMPPPHHALTHACHHDTLTPLDRPTPERHPKRYLQRYPLRPTTPPSQITVAIIAIRIHAMLYKAVSLPHGHALAPHQCSLRGPPPRPPESPCRTPNSPRLLHAHFTHGPTHPPFPLAPPGPQPLRPHNMCA